MQALQQNIVMDIFLYTDYRHFLNDWHHRQLQNRKSWSLGKFAQLLSLSSASSIANIMSGKKIPSPETIDKISQLLLLNQREKMYLEGMVESHRHANNALLASSIKKTMTLIKPSGTQVQITDEIFKLISNPYFFVIREMVNLKDFQFNYEWIQQRLCFSIDLSEIEKTIKTLIDVKLLKLENGRLHTTTDFFETGTDLPSEFVKDFHRKNLEHSIQMIDSTPMEKRHFTSDTIALNTSQIQQIKSLIETFRKEVTGQYETKSGDAVYQINVQLVPTTHIIP